MAVRKIKTMNEEINISEKKKLRKAYIDACNAFDKVFNSYGYHKEYDSKTGDFVVFSNDNPHEFYLAKIKLNLDLK